MASVLFLPMMINTFDHLQTINIRIFFFESVIDLYSEHLNNMI